MRSVNCASKSHSKGFQILESIVSIPVSFDVGDLLDLHFPPKRFAANTFDSFVPDPLFPSQVHAKLRAMSFAFEVSEYGTAKPESHRWHLPHHAKLSNTSQKGLYIDGSFGVGKTHILSAIWDAVSVAKAFTSFVNLVNIVGVLGLDATVDGLEHLSFLAIDEFELDDPGETVLISTLVSKLFECGVSIAVTSNTLPERLGAGRFSSGDFLREIQGLADRFDILALDGMDHRVSTDNLSQLGKSDSDFVENISNATSRVTFDYISELAGYLSTMHPVMYHKLIRTLDAIVVVVERPMSFLFEALRFVVLVDRAYEMEVPFVTLGIEVHNVFSSELLNGAYSMKFGRCVSRLLQLRSEARRFFEI